MRNRTLWSAVLLGCLGWLSLGCAQPPRPLQFEMSFEQGAPLPETAQVAAAANCPVVLAGVTDERSNQESIGEAGMPVIATGIVEWTRDGLAWLADYGHPYADLARGDVERRGLELAVAVNKVYCRSQPMSLRGVVVLTVQYRQGETALGQRIYRGEAVQDKGLLFGNVGTGFSADAALRVLNEALRHAIAEIHADVIALSGANGGS